jgi:DNA-binding transcriptional MerR regulator
MRVIQLAKKLGVSSDTVRYYTRIGLLKPAKNQDNGYNNYTTNDYQRIRFILNARHIGFSVKDIKTILREADNGKSSCPTVRQLLKKRLHETERQFREVLKLRNRMKAAIEDWQDKPDLEPSGDMVCHLIEDFPSSYDEEEINEKN